ncbi:nucleosome assembly protein 1-like 1 [Scyliorhinus canicula]|uniref:nucleosome assembly protein 1-like 1 n=1 Tax=Scyliorhinus canicula TaxID=7830 RepID=UPI0018F66153|nr:nucleosome assembly protein 1-like 1 [Scyliorhinus canicula]
MVQLSDEIIAKVKVEEDKPDEGMEEPKGIPEFWLTIFKNVDSLSDMIQEHEEKDLQDVKVKCSDPGQPMSFILEFTFEPNEYFTNKVVTKTYKMESQPEQLDFFFFDELTLTGCTGCNIDWKNEKYISLKTIKTKQKHKGRGTGRTVTKTVPKDSFFNFFNPPDFPEHGALDEGSAARLAADFEIGHFLQENIIPQAMSYFTGEAIADDGDYDDDNYDDYDYDDEREESDVEPEEEDYESLFSSFGSSDKVTTSSTQSAQDNDKCESSKMACAEAESEIATADKSDASKSTAN